MPTKEVKGMMDIINKLNESVKPSEEKSKPTVNKKLAGVSKNAQGMLEILQKLDEATTKVTKNIIKESRDDIELAAMNKKGNSVRVEDYEVVLEKAQVVPGIKKTFYTIKQGNKVIHEQLSLFETAMGVVKGLLFEIDSKVERLLDLDNRYVSALQEAATYKVKCRTINEQNKIDIAMAKQGAAVSKMKDIKNQIKSAL